MTDAKKDVMADSAPKAVLEEKKVAKEVVEVTATYTDGKTPGKNPHTGMILDHRNYIQNPDPNKAYKFCSLRDTHIARNNAKGWKPERIAGKPIDPVGRMVLCSRPKEVSEAHEKWVAETAMKKAKKADRKVDRQLGNLGTPTTTYDS